MHHVGMGGALVAIAAVQVVTTAAILGAGHRNLAMNRVLPYLVSGAAGVLLSTACLDLLPEAVRDAGSGLGMWQVLLGTLLSLFCVQTCAHWFSERLEQSEQSIENGAAGDGTHVHNARQILPSRQAGKRVAPGTLLLGSALHSLVDGVAIAAAFAAGPRPGWSVTLAVGLHELPHRLGDFALLLHMQMPRKHAAIAAVAAGAMAIPGAVAVGVFGHSAGSDRWLLPVSAGSFLYIALVDLLPGMHATGRGGNLWWQLACLCGGAALMAVAVHAGGA